MELAFGIITITTLVSFCVCGCKARRQIRNLETRLSTIEQQEQKNQQQQQMKQMIQESILTFPQQAYVAPSAPPSRSFNPVNVA